MTAFLLVCVALAIAWALSEVSLWWEYRHAAEDAEYDALRDPHMGELPTWCTCPDDCDCDGILVGDSPIFDALCLERLDAELDADR